VLRLKHPLILKKPNRNNGIAFVRGAKPRATIYALFRAVLA
jgi:hypothetical protein